MSIALIVTRGYGNGTLTGSIANVASRGYTIGDAILAAIGNICLMATDARISALSAIDARINALGAAFDIDQALSATDAGAKSLKSALPSC